MTFLVLLFAHLLADYPLQGDFLANMKGKRILLMLTHCGIWSGCIAIAGHFMGLPSAIGPIGRAFVIHFGIDTFKAEGGYGKADPLGWPLWCDQLLHVGQICAYIWLH